MPGPAHFDGIDACIETLLATVGKRIVIGIPLGTGKPNRLVNALYRRACSDTGIELTIFTALTPQVPPRRSLLEKRLLDPVVARLYRDYTPLDYADAVRTGTLPSNIEVVEFYFAPGAYLTADYAQRQHVSANYSQVTQALIDHGVNVVAQTVAARGSGARARYSLGSNPDLTLDLVRDAEPGQRPYLIGHVSDAMPFMPNDAETGSGFWDAIIDDRGASPPDALFAVPNKPVGLVDYAIATHVTSMIEDGGTLQIGIGSHGDAVAHVIRLRERDNAAYRQLAERLIGYPQRSLRPALPVRAGRFEQGLYAASEMLVEGLLHLLDAGVIRRRVACHSDPDRTVLLHAAFFLGAPAFYRRLHALAEDQRNAIEMTGVRFVNTLDDDFARKCQQRHAARFVNSAMMVTLDGAIVSDTLAGKRVVSGVGGQHDFVAMAQHLPGARSIIVLPSTRTKNGRTDSNIVFDYAQITIPRQLRDVVVTEYGAADLRSASDRDVMVRMICIADARFQETLLDRAKAAGKIELSYRIPAQFRDNFPARLERDLGAGLSRHLPVFPLSSDLDATEARIAAALDSLRAFSPPAFTPAAVFGAAFWRSVSSLARIALDGGESPDTERAFGTRDVLARMQLTQPRSLAERIQRRLLLGALARTQSDRPLFSDDRPSSD